jgi:hypothetical protein
MKQTFTVRQGALDGVDAAPTGRVHIEVRVVRRTMADYSSLTKALIR